LRARKKYIGVDVKPLCRGILHCFGNKYAGVIRNIDTSECTEKHFIININIIRIVRVVTSRRMRWAGHVARVGEERGVHRLLVGIPEEKRPLGRPRRRWEDNIKMNLQEIRGDREDWMELAQDRDGWRALVSTVKNFRVP
jgi:hypothetical protein